MAGRAQTAVGSAPWIHAEKENAAQLLQQEIEELVYPAQHEMEWLNEHMAEIFSKSQFNVTDVFKTPGKLRGKTPRTARKRNAPESRIPLSDIFSSQLHAIASPKRTPKPDRPVLSFVIAQDPHEERKVQNAPALPKQYTDSGYHGSQEDEMDVDIPARISSYKPSPPAAPNQDNRPGETTQEAAGSLSAERRTTEGSFHSAREDMTAKVPFAVPETNNSNKDVHGQELHPAESAPSKAGAGDSHEKTGDLGAEPDQKRDLVQELDDIGSPSDGSTPDRPLVRKSSLTFASLPAREPLNTKKSFGTRDSRTSHLDQLRNGRSSHFGKQTAAALPITTESQKNGYIDQMMVDVDEARTVDTEDADLIAAQAHSKSSTQRLHEKIDMLGKSQPSRPSKSIPSATALAASNLKKSEAVMKADKEAVARTVDQSAVDEDDDWIKPLESSEKDIRPPLTKSYTTDVMENIGGNENGDDDDEMEFDIRAPELIAHEERMRTPVRISPSPGKMLPGFGHAKSASTVTLASPGKAALAPGLGHTKTISVSNPPYPSTTPKGSPRRIFDAPLSASKSKLQSIMKTAKGLFTSSAGVSAAAKMETLSPKALHMAANNMPGLYPNITSMLEDKPLPPSPAKEGRKTRSSTEREREEKKKEREIRDRQKAEEQLEKAREKEKQSAAQFKAEERNALAQSSRPLQPIRKSPRKAAEEQQEIEQPPESHDMPPPALPSLQGKAQRPAKPTREPPKKNRPQPMSIRVGSTLSQRMPITTASLASNLQDILPPNNPNPSNAKAPVVSKKTSNASLNSSTSNPGFKSSVTAPAGKPRALLAAERKKEADEREAQRKLEQKREAERKRAAQQEEARRQEQKERAEAEHKARERIAAEQAKKSAQQQAIEKRRQEQTKKMEQQRNAIVANDMNGPSVGPPRPPSRLGTAPTLNRPLMSHNLPTNPAKPPKRPHEDEAGPSRSQAAKYGAASSQADAKRRRTDDEETIEPASRPTMSGAPIRQSNMGKKPSIFSHGYVSAPNGPHLTQAPANQLHQFPPPPNNPPHRVVHASEMSKYANGNKIPFADAPNPPGYPPNHHKTPSHQQQQYAPKSTLQLVKSSPQPQHQQYTPGEAISLPEIPTDSEEDEDEDDDDSSSPPPKHNPRLPSWASPNTLTAALLAQEAVDGDAVFGPVAPLKMEEIFGGKKERLKDFRKRTSSANWVASGDGLTLEEVRRDREMRERMRRDGGWRFEG